MLNKMYRFESCNVSILYSKANLMWRRFNFVYRESQRRPRLTSLVAKNKKKNRHEIFIFYPKKGTLNVLLIFLKRNNKMIAMFNPLCRWYLYTYLPPILHNQQKKYINKKWKKIFTHTSYSSGKKNVIICF